MKGKAVMVNDFMDEWPTISFTQIANEEVEGGFIGTFYRMFFAVLRFPETMVTSFFTLLKEEPR